MTPVRALLFDAGNTRLKWGYLSAGRISKTGSVSHAKLHEKGYAVLTTRLPREVSHAVASNVAGPGFAAKLASVIGLHCGAEMHFAHCEKFAGGVTAGYRQPRRMGIDRWMAMIGAWNEFRCALCIVDAGTAMTIDMLDNTGQHLGGQIIPGIRMMEDSLRRKTSDIAPARPVKRNPGDKLAGFGKNTDEAIVNGSMNAACGAIERAAKQARRAGMRPKIILTGGDASRILKQLNDKPILRPNLVLDGLAVMLPSQT